MSIDVGQGDAGTSGGVQVPRNAVALPQGLRFVAPLMGAVLLEQHC
jgi:hypothetical protein